MSLITFLNSVGPLIGDIDLGDLGFLNTIAEDDRYFGITEEFREVGVLDFENTDTHREKIHTHKGNGGASSRCHQ